MPLNATFFQNLVDKVILNYSNHPIKVYKWASATKDEYLESTNVYSAAVTVRGHYSKKGDEDTPSIIGKVNEDKATVVFSLPELRRVFPSASENSWIDTKDIIEYFGIKYTIICVQYTGFMYEGDKLLKLDLMEYPDPITVS